MWNKVKSSIADHAGQFNHFINWDAARILQMKSDAGTRYIFESLKGKGALDNFNICLFISNSTEDLNGWQLAKMKKSIPDMSLP